MTKEELLKELEECRKIAEEDPERSHIRAAFILLRYIGDVEIRAAWDRIKPGWYS